MLRRVEFATHDIPHEGAASADPLGVGSSGTPHRPDHHRSTADYECRVSDALYQREVAENDLDKHCPWQVGRGPTIKLLRARLTVRVVEHVAVNQPARMHDTQESIE